MKKLYSFYLDIKHMDFIKKIADKESRSAASLLSKIIYDYLVENGDRYGIKKIPGFENKIRSSIPLKVKYRIWKDSKDVSIKDISEKYRVSIDAVEKIIEDGNPAFIKFEKEFGDPIKNKEVYEQWLQKNFV